MNQFLIAYNQPNLKFLKFYEFTVFDNFKIKSQQNWYAPKLYSKLGFKQHNMKRFGNLTIGFPSMLWNCLQNTTGCTITP